MTIIAAMSRTTVAARGTILPIAPCMAANLPESQFPPPSLADHQTCDLQHRQRTKYLRRWQTGRDRDLVGGARAAGRKRVVDPLLGVGEIVKQGRLAF